MTITPIAETKNASKTYKSGDTVILALKTTSITINKGELVLLLGPSGSGKTTLLSLLGCVIYPSEGEVFLSNQSINELTDAELSDMRLREIGFVFQNYNLVSPLSALENVMLPLQLRGKGRGESREQAIEALTLVGMEDRMRNTPRKLSGGQQQRVAIARALVNNPSLILCDEPTASLDPKSVAYIMDRFRKLADDGRTIVIVTHDMRLVPYADRIYEVDNGNVKKTDEPNFQIN